MRETQEAPSIQEAAEILLRLVAALSVHDRITRGHAERVRAYSHLLGTQLGLSKDELDRLNWAALLHDVGKLEVSREILNKSGKPTDEEWQLLRLHPEYGEMLVEPLREWLGEWAEAVGQHHERWDGKGYPRGLAGEEISRAGRIVAIADVYDVITSARSYKEPASTADARAEIVRCAGAQFDERYVRAFVDVSLTRMRLVLGPLSWLTHAPLLARIPLTQSVGATLGGLAAVAAATTTALAGPADTPQAAALRNGAAPIVAAGTPDVGGSRRSPVTAPASGDGPAPRPRTNNPDTTREKAERPGDAPSAADDPLAPSGPSEPPAHRRVSGTGAAGERSEPGPEAPASHAARAAPLRHRPILRLRRPRPRRHRRHRHRSATSSSSSSSTTTTATAQPGAYLRSGKRSERFRGRRLPVRRLGDGNLTRPRARVGSERHVHRVHLEPGPLLGAACGELRRDADLRARSRCLRQRNDHRRRP